MSKPNVGPFHIRALRRWRGKESNLLTPGPLAMFASPGQVPFVGPLKDYPESLRSGEAVWACLGGGQASDPTRPGDAFDKAAGRECTLPVWRGRY